MTRIPALACRQDVRRVRHGLNVIINEQLFLLLLLLLIIILVLVLLLLLIIIFVHLLCPRGHDRVRQPRGRAVLRLLRREQLIVVVVVVVIIIIIIIIIII